MPKIEVTVTDGVATIHTGRNKGLMIACGTTARCFLAGHQPRATIADALALSAGYLDALRQIESLKLGIKNLKARK